MPHRAVHRVRMNAMLRIRVLFHAVGSLLNTIPCV
jgi:hypothetical protein